MAVSIKRSDGNIVSAHLSEFYTLGIDPWLLWNDKIVLYFKFDSTNALAQDITPICNGKPANEKYVRLSVQGYLKNQEKLVTEGDKNAKNVMSWTVYANLFKYRKTDFKHTR